MRKDTIRSLTLWATTAQGKGFYNESKTLLALLNPPMLVIKAISEYLTFFGIQSHTAPDNLDNVIKKSYRLSANASAMHTVEGRCTEEHI